jgi:hypothetical protein
MKMTNDERMQRESSLIATIRKNLPDFAKACADDTELVLLHQDAFAADYQEDEYLLLGMAIKYAGLRGKEVRVIGKNRSTLGEADIIQRDVDGAPAKRLLVVSSPHAQFSPGRTQMRVAKSVDGGMTL